MNLARIALLVCALALFAAVADSAQGAAMPGRERLQSMSQEELAGYREQIQSRVEGLGAAERRLMRDAGIDGRNQVDSRSDGGGYGQGYGSRNGQGAGQDNGRGGGHGRGGGRHR